MNSESYSYGRPSWQSFAACRGIDTSIFFPERGHHKQLDLARRICSECPVKDECLEYAISKLPREQGDVGVWGGTSAKERRAIIRRRRNAANKKAEAA